MEVDELGQPVIHFEYRRDVCSSFRKECRSDVNKTRRHTLFQVYAKDKLFHQLKPALSDIFHVERSPCYVHRPFSFSVAQHRRKGFSVANQEMSTN